MNQDTGIVVITIACMAMIWIGTLSMTYINATATPPPPIEQIDNWPGGFPLNANHMHIDYYEGFRVPGARCKPILDFC